MDLLYNITKWIVYIEFSIIVIIIFMTLILKFLIYIKSEYDKKITLAVTNYLKKIDPNINNFNFDKFKNHWRKLNILLPIINQLDLQIEQKWENIRILFFHSVVLPLARNDALSHDWGFRFYAAKAFSIFFEATDEPYILKLVEDKIPLIRYNAIIPAILCGSEKAINSIIARAAQEPWLTQFIYLREFYNASGTSRVYIENHLIHSTDNRIRYVCYKLLLNYSPLKATWDYLVDIHSSDTKLKMAALTYITYIDHETAVPLIISSLKDPDWHVRAAALICIRKLKLHQAIADVIPYLNDPNQWVGLVAMQTLYDLGDKGVQALNAKKVIYKPVALDITNHIIKM